MSKGTIDFAEMKKPDGTDTVGIAKDTANIREFAKVYPVKTGDVRRMVESAVREYVREMLTASNAEAQAKKALACLLDKAINQKIATLNQEVHAALLNEIKARAVATVAAMSLTVTVSGESAAQVKAVEVP